MFGASSSDHEKVAATSGIGLGLSMSHDLIKALKGKIFVDSKVNVGTEVVFSLKLTCPCCDL